MDKKTLLAVVLSMLVLFGWQFLFAPKLEPQKNAADNSSAVSGDTAAKQQPVQAETPVIKQDMKEAAPSSARLVEVESDTLKITFNADTGDIRNASILKWNDTDGDKITFNKNGVSDYASVITPVSNGFTERIENTPNGKRVVFTGQSGALIVSKIYEIDNGSYLIKTSVDIANSGGSSLNTPLDVSIGPGLGSGFEDSSYVFEGAIISNGNKTYRVKMKDDDSEKLDTAKWAGYTSKYFLFAAASNSIFKQAEISPIGSAPAASVKTDFIVNPNDRIQVAFDIYIGPKYYQDLKALNLSLQKSMDYGWFYFIAIPMLYILNYLYGIIHNYGVAIIILTVIVKAVTLPLTLKSMISMKEMSKLQPKVLELKEKYKNDQAKLNQATMDLYREHKVNPLSGCLPLLLQIPIFFALYKALLLSLELKDAAFFGWLTDLSAKDPYYITPIIMGLTMFIQQKMTPSTADPVQQKIFLAMPVIFTFLFINFPSGLVVYWLTNNVLAIIQQYIINKRRA